MNLAIMQPCYLPWRGYFALLRRCDVFVYLDDVLLPAGRSYQTRVAYKTGGERRWLSVPVRRRRGTLVADAEIEGDAWRRKHAASLRQELPAAFEIVADLYERTWTHLTPLNRALAERLAAALGIERPTHRSRDLDVGLHEGSERILAICRTLGATRYLTGHGGRKYLDHERFAEAGIEVHYLNYDLTPYPQPHGPFDPFVTVLDVIEHVADPLVFVDAEPVPWRAFLERPVGLARPERG